MAFAENKAMLYEIQSGKAHSSLLLDERQFACDFFNDCSVDELEDVCLKLAANIKRRVKKGFRPIRVLLPDTWVTQAQFDVDKGLKSKKEVLSLIKWRFQKDFYIDQNDYEFSYQLYKDNIKPFVSAYAVKRKHLEAVVGPFRRSGLLVDWVDCLAVRQYAFLSFYLPKTSGVLVALNADYWCVVCWDGRGQLKFMRAHGYENVGEPLNPNQVSSEIRRVLNIYTNASRQNTFEKKYSINFLANAEHEVNGLGYEFDVLSESGVLGGKLEETLRSCNEHLWRGLVAESRV